MQIYVFIGTMPKIKIFKWSMYTQYVCLVIFVLLKFKEFFRQGEQINFLHQGCHRLKKGSGGLNRIVITYINLQ